MPDEMNARIMKAEWEIQSLKEGQRQQGDRMAELSARMDTHHKEVMAAIGSLKDDRAKAQGAARARLHDSEVRQNRLKWLSFGLAAIGTLVALGWVGEAKAVTPVNYDYADPPIIIQLHTKDFS